MGVDRTDYLMFGADLGAKAFDWDKHEAESNGAPGRRFDIVYDSMCGKYCIAGKIIASSDPYEGFEMAKIDPNELGIDPAISFLEWSEMGRLIDFVFGNGDHVSRLRLDGFFDSVPIIELSC